jgi:type 1 glutamine amidotransferase
MNVAYRNTIRTLLLCCLLVLVAAGAQAEATLKALIVDGQNNHPWQETTPFLKSLLEETGLFKVDVVTSPAQKQPMDNFKPEFAKYNVVVLNYNGDEWPDATKKAFEEYVKNGGGVVVFHAANNSFPSWKAYNEIIAVGGWGNRNEKTAGPMIRYRDGKMVLDTTTPGPGGSHGPQHEFQLVTRDTEHPITKGLPEKWMHTADELYSTLRGPAQNVTLLATAFADPAKGGTGENEPILFTVSWGKGRIFHDCLGHAGKQMKSVGFIVTYQRGAEWAATGKVTQKIPADFPTADKPTEREPKK